MKLKGADLLKRLEPAIRPVGDVRLDGRTPLDEAEFAELLGLARRGLVASDRAIDARSLTAPLDTEALLRIGRALDLLEAAGMRTALVVYGPRPLVVDVASRTIEHELSAQESPSWWPVEAALRVVMPGEPLPSRVPGPPQGVPASLGAAELLAARHSLSELRSTASGTIGVGAST